MKQENWTRRDMVALLLASGLGLAAGVPGRAAASLHFATTVLPPFSVDDKAAPGALVEVVLALLKEMQIEASMAFYPWRRAVTLAKAGPHTVVLPLSRTAEREKDYRWLVKLYRQNFVFMSRAGDGLDPNGENALRFKRIATLRGAPHASYLRRRGYRDVVEAASAEEAQRFLDQGIADAVFGGEQILRRTLLRRGQDSSTMMFGKTIYAEDIWLGGSLDFSASDAAQFQDAMARLVKRGDYARIFKKYDLDAMP